MSLAHVFAGSRRRFVFRSSLLRREEEVAVAVARKAAELVLEVYRTDFGVDYKGEGTSNPVTLADQRANDLIVASLREHFPDDGIVAGESDNHESALKKRRIWYVDPLDGTKEFIAKNGEFSVMIGLSVDGRAQLGVVLQPSEGRLYRGVVGRGASVEFDGHLHALAVSETASPAELRLVVSRSHRPKSTEELCSRLGISRESKSGSVGLKVGLIAEQRADLYVHVSDKSSAWDTCAPEAVLRAAGGRFTDLAGREITYGGSDLRTRCGILACNARAFDAVLPVVSELGRREGYV